MSPSNSKDQFQAHAQALLREILSREPDFSPHIEHVIEQRELLGEGGMGRVLRVKDKRLGRDAALKILQPRQDDPDAVLRFKREAQIMARLDHPGIPPVYEAGRTPEGSPFMLMKVVEGVTLDERIRQFHEDRCHDDDRDELLRVMIKVAEALAYTHSRGVIHRDIKPENIMIGAFGEVLLMDWGLAKQIKDKDDPRLTRSGLYLSAVEAQNIGLTNFGTVLGTPGYMPPEQARSGLVDERSDVFGLGSTLYALLSGRCPIPGETVPDVLKNTLKGQWPTLREAGYQGPQGLVDIVNEAMTGDANMRTESAEEFARQLQAFLEKRHLMAPAGLGAKLLPWSLLVMAVMGCVTLFWAWQQEQGARQQLLAVSEEQQGRALEREQRLKTLEQQVKAGQAAKTLSESTQERRRQRRLLAQRLAAMDNLKARSQQLLAFVEDHRDSDSAWWAVRQAQAWGDVALSRTILTDIQSRFEPSSRVLFELAWAEIQIHRGFQKGEALKWIEQVQELAERQGLDDAYSNFAKAMGRRGQISISKALPLITKALTQEHGRHPVIYLFLASLQASSNDLEAAAKSYNKAVQIGPRSSFVLCQRAEFLASKQRFEAALRDLQGARAVSVDQADRLRIDTQRGQILYRQGHFGRALQVLEETTMAYDKSFPKAGPVILQDKKTALLFRVYCFERLGQSFEATQALRAMFGAGWSVESLAFEARRRCQQRDIKTSQELLDKLLKRSPKMVDVLLLQAKLAVLRRQLPQALSCCRRVLKRRQDLKFYLWPDVLVTLAEAQSLTLEPSNIQEALRNCFEAASSGPYGAIVGRFMRARIAYFTGTNRRQADLDLRFVLSRDPDHVPALRLRLRLLTMMGRLDEAKDFANWAVAAASAETPWRSQALLERGILAFHNRAYTEALFDIQKARQLNDLLPEPCYWLGRVLLQKKQPKSALVEFHEAQRRGGVGPEYDLAMGEAYWQLGDAKEALKFLNKSIERNASSPRPFEFRAKCYDQLGQPEKAQKDRERVRAFPR